MYAIMKYILSSASALVQENTNSDIVFEDNTVGVSYNGTHISNSVIYNNPDYKKYILSNIGFDVCTIHTSGIVTPVRVAPNLQGYNGMQKLLSIFKGRANGVDVTKGVLIVEQYSIAGSTHDQSKSLIEYYLDSTNIDYNIDVVNDIRQVIKQNVSRKSSISKCSIRICHFVPESELKEHHCVYHEESDTMLLYGLMDNSYVHPNSRLFKDNKEKQRLASETNNNIIAVDIVTDDITQPYFIKFGNEVIKLLPSKNSNIDNGVNVKLKRNGVIVSDTHTDIKSIENLGIYKSVEQCETEGDVKLKLENDKLEHEKEKLEYSKLKLESDIQSIKVENELILKKYEHEIYMYDIKVQLGNMDLNKKLLDHELDISTKLLGIKIDTHKAIADINIRLQKHSLDMEKADADNYRDRADFVMKMTSNALTLGKQIFK